MGGVSATALSAFQTGDMHDPMLSVPAFCEFIGVGKSTYYVEAAAGRMPKPRQITRGRVGIPLSEAKAFRDGLPHVELRQAASKVA
ncbi:MAG: hypothetical protein IKE66_01100 [Hyphomicrobium sp.]|nr:hypothetical protein [Hyphomicrobium sp.]